MSKNETLYTTTRIRLADRENMTKLCKKMGMTAPEFLQHSIAYFKKSGIDPREEKSPAEQLAEMNKRLEQVIKLFRVFERDDFKPLFFRMVELATKLENTPTTEHFEDLENRLQKGFQMHKERYEHLNKQNENLAGGVKTVVQNEKALYELAKDIMSGTLGDKATVKELKQKHGLS